MRASIFFRISTVILISFALSLLVTLFWAITTLADSRLQLKQYQLLKAEIAIDFNRTISRYFRSGDATLLVDAEKKLSQISIQADSIEDQQLSASIKKQANNLVQLLTTDFRALGKQSGDPMALLKNSELAIAGSVEQLARFARESNAINTATQLRYMQLTGNIATTLSSLIIQRQAMFNAEEINSNALSQLLASLKQQNKMLSELPALEIYVTDEDEDELGFDDEEAEDVSEEALSELNSAINRYQSDLDLTVQQQTKINQGFALLTEQVELLEQLVIAGQQVVDQDSEAINDNVKTIVTAVVVMLLIVVAVSYLFQLLWILKPLRLLRNSFKELVETGEVKNISGMDEQTELGEISVSFNQMVEKLREEDKQKAQQLSLVSAALNSMQQQADDIYQTSTTSASHVDTLRDIMTLLGQATDTVNELSTQVVDTAKATQKAMTQSQVQVEQALHASESTATAAESGKASIQTLGQSVDSVSTIVEVISSIADQTNLLALNAAIEAARAGEHGRGFSVVADEVRQLASKTQDSLGQISKRLEQLQLASKTLEQFIVDIAVASSQQKHIASQLKDNADMVVEQAQTSASVAQDTLSHITQQRSHYREFSAAMADVADKVKQSQTIANNISNDVNQQVTDISKTLAVH